MTKIALVFPESEIADWAKKYQYPRNEEDLIGLRLVVQKTGCLNKAQLRKVAHWKSPRIVGHIDNNDDGYVEEITSFAFSAKEERTRIEVLTLLDGVMWPMASVILHLFHKDKYPILDFRALWSVGLEVPKQYLYSFWWSYVRYCRELANRNSIDMRTLDRALWQYSKENQKR